VRAVERHLDAMRKLPADAWHAAEVRSCNLRDMAGRRRPATILAGRGAVGVPQVTCDLRISMRQVHRAIEEGRRYRFGAQCRDTVRDVAGWFDSLPSASSAPAHVSGSAC